MRRWSMIGLLSVVTIIIGILIWQQEHKQDPQTEDVTLRIALWDYEETTYDREVVDAFEAAYPDIKIEVVSYPSEFYSYRIETLLRSGEQVDVIYSNQMAMLSELQEDGFALTLDGLISRDIDDLNNYMYTDEMRSADGILAGLPYRMDKFVLYYNKDLFDAAGLPYPDSNMTWKEFYETSNLLQQTLQGEEQHSIYSIYLSTHWCELLTSAPFRVSDLDLEQLRDGLELVNDMQAKGSMVSLSQMCSRRATQRVFENGNYGMFLNGTWMMHYFVNDTASGVCDFRWGVTERPHWDDMPNEDAAWVTSLCINRNSVDIEAAWKFVQFVCGAEGAKILADDFIVPAYHTEEIDQILQEKELQYDIALDLTPSGFTAPQAVRTAAERQARQDTISIVGEVMLGLKSVDQGLAEVKIIQQDFNETK